MAAQKLKEVRPKFVKTVGKEMINELLDHLYTAGVFTEGEKDAILEENLSKNDKARKLIDRVTNKGAKSCEMMIAYLQQEDPTLSSELGLSDVQIAQADAVPSEKFISIEEFWCSKQNDPMVYKVTKENYKSRVALLITNITFTDPRMSRQGADTDHKNMEKQLSDMGYEVVKYTNLSGKEMDEAVKKFAQHPKLKDTDSVVVVLMSHGKLGAVLGVNYTHKEPDEFNVNNIYKYLGSENCPALIDKPKIIIIQACRGEEVGAVFMADDVPGEPVEELQDDAVGYVHKEKDFLSFLSSTPDTKSYRHPQDGSLLIQYFVAQCKESADKDHIIDVMIKIQNRFDNLKAGSIKQMAVIDRTSLVKHFYFFPGLCVRS